MVATNTAPPVDDARVIEEWLQELSSGANCADKVDGWKLTPQGKMGREKSKRRLAILREALSRIPSEEATEEEIDTRLIDAFVGVDCTNVERARVAMDYFKRRLTQHGLAITRAPGAKT